MCLTARVEPPFRVVFSQLAKHLKIIVAFLSTPVLSQLAISLRASRFYSASGPSLAHQFHHSFASFSTRSSVPSLAHQFHHRAHQFHHCARYFHHRVRYFHHLARQFHQLHASVPSPLRQFHRFAGRSHLLAGQFHLIVFCLYLSVNIHCSPVCELSFQCLPPPPLKLVTNVNVSK